MAYTQLIYITFTTLCKLSFGTVLDGKSNIYVLACNSKIYLWMQKCSF